MRATVATWASSDAHGRSRGTSKLLNAAASAPCVAVAFGGSVDGGCSVSPPTRAPSTWLCHRTCSPCPPSLRLLRPPSPALCPPSPSPSPLPAPATAPAPAPRPLASDHQSVDHKPRGMRTASSLSTSGQTRRPSSSRTWYGAVTPGGIASTPAVISVSSRYSRAPTIPGDQAHVSVVRSSAARPGGPLLTSTRSPKLKRSAAALASRLAGVARHALNEAASALPSRFLPMNTSLLSRPSPSAQGSAKAPSKVMCTAW
eukprot:scaffold64387_cov64-Phaeocystis_antarctica.AAC.2